MRGPVLTRLPEPPPVACRHSSWPAVLTVVAAVAGFGWAYDHVHPSGAPKPRVITRTVVMPPRTVTRVVVDHAPVLSGWQVITLTVVVMAALVAALAIAGRRWGR